MQNSEQPCGGIHPPAAPINANIVTPRLRSDLSQLTEFRTSWGRGDLISCDDPRFQGAEVSITRYLFAAILKRIRRLMQPVPV